MGVAEYAKILVTHPNEFRAMINYSVWRNPLRTLEDDPASSGWDREDMRRCWGLLDECSRSFASVIKELEGDLARVVRLLSRFSSSSSTQLNWK
jgi:farnesyl-diphosphate farnesyltransferase